MEILTENHAHFLTFRVRERVLKLFDNYLTRSFISLKKFDLFNSCNDNKTESNAHCASMRTCYTSMYRQTGIESADFRFCFVFLFFASGHISNRVCVRCVCVRCLCVRTKFRFTDGKLFIGMFWRVGNPIITHSFIPQNKIQWMRSLNIFVGSLYYADPMWCVLYIWTIYTNEFVCFLGAHL